MIKILILLTMQSLPIDGMYIQTYDVSLGYVSYFDFYFIAIDSKSKTCRFFSPTGEMLLESTLSVDSNSFICNEAKLILAKKGVDQIELTFIENLNINPVVYSRIKKIEPKEEGLPRKAENQNSSDLSFVFHDDTGMKHLFPIKKIDAKRFEYFNSISGQIEEYELK